MKILKKSLQIWPRVFQTTLPWIFINLAVQFTLTILQQMLPQRETGLMMSWYLFVFGVTLFFSVIGVIIVNQAAWAAENNKIPSMKLALDQNFKFVMIESLRAMLPIIYKFCLFIVPGVIESIRLYWITYVVQFDERYKRGEIDALEESRSLTKGHLWKACFVLIFASSLSILPRLGSGNTKTLSDSFLLAILIFISVILEVFGDIVLYRFYFTLKGQTQSGTKI
jgi:hypothetical protein